MTDLTSPGIDSDITDDAEDLEEIQHCMTLATINGPIVALTFAFALFSLFVQNNASSFHYVYIKCIYPGDFLEVVYAIYVTVALVIFLGICRYHANMNARGEELVKGERDYRPSHRLCFSICLYVLISFTISTLCYGMAHLELDESVIENITLCPRLQTMGFASLHLGVSVAILLSVFYFVRQLD